MLYLVLSETSNGTVLITLPFLSTYSILILPLSIAVVCNSRVLKPIMDDVVELPDTSVNLVVPLE
ncbi:hypothetical protein FGL74_02450 [Leuconostoc koreense]|nr:hypothetical protein FGL74_02450 [Leuconostoc mesenteroides]QGM24544.1 hypothetical protein GJV51_00435 [Leuconostoc mesenteroides subsp. mesenteroides]